MFLASLPWYDLKEIRPATDALWSYLARELRKQEVSGVPERLERHMLYERQWTSGKLLFSQACGYDVLLPYRNHLRLVATPVYDAPGCHGASYSSVILVPDDSPAQHLAELRDARCVVNTCNSHSGMNALRALVAPLHQNGRFFSRVTISNSHEASLAMISERQADVAAIDCVVYALVQRHRPAALSGTRVLCHSRRMPAPPFVTRAGASEQDLRRIQTALFETLAVPAMQAAKQLLLLNRAEIVPVQGYQPIADLEREALQTGYFEIPPTDQPGELSRIVSPRQQPASA